MDAPRITVEAVVELLRRGVPLTFVDARAEIAWQVGQYAIPGSLRIPPDQVDWAIARVPLSVAAISYCT